MIRNWPVGTLEAAAVGFFVLVATVVIATRDEPVDAPAVRAPQVAAEGTHRRTPPPREGTHRKSAKPALATPSMFAQEAAMSMRERMKRWDEHVAEASKRFSVPQTWIRAVIQAESAGRTMLAEGKPIVSSMGAMGLMQLMPGTYEDMRRNHNLGADPHDPHDNIMAGTAYLRWLKDRYGYPAMFAAYNDGPGHLDQRIANAGLLPTETVTYVERITTNLEGKGSLVKFTRPNGTPVMVEGAQVRGVRAALPGEYAPGVQSVITVGAVEQGVRETLATAKAIILARGGAIRTKTRLVLSTCERQGTDASGRITCRAGH